VQSAAGKILVDQLKLDAGGTSFPLVVNKGSSQTVMFTMTSMKPLAASDRDALCAGQVQIIGSVVDTLKSGTDSLSSNLTHADLYMSTSPRADAAPEGEVPGIDLAELRAQLRDFRGDSGGEGAEIRGAEHALQNLERHRHSGPAHARRSRSRLPA